MSNTELPIVDRDFELWVLLQHTRDAIFKNRERELYQYGVSTMEAGVLFIIESRRPNKPTVTEISRWIFREPHTVSELLNRMQRKGLITKATDKERKNVVRVSMTDKGRKAFLESLKRESVHDSLSVLSEEKRKQLISILKTLRDRALGGNPPPPFPNL